VPVIRATTTAKVKRCSAVPARFLILKFNFIRISFYVKVPPSSPRRDKILAEEVLKAFNLPLKISDRF
jgi:hypothetical protein